MKFPEIIAHRGASYLAPENTLSAFREAMSIGADGVEMDVQQTLDGGLVIHHDYIIDLHTDITGKIYDMLYEDLRELDFGSWKDAIYEGERIASLQEALELCKSMEGAIVQLELKSPIDNDPEFLPRVLEEIRAVDMNDRLILISFNHEMLRQAKERMPELKVGVLLYGALETMVLPTGMWERLGLQNGLEDDKSDFLDLPFDPANVDDENCSQTTRWLNDKLNMLRANFPGKSLREVVRQLMAQRDPEAYVKSLDFHPDYVSCEYHTTYQQPTLVQRLHALDVKVAFWTVDTEDEIRDLLPLEPDCIVTNRPDRMREWITEALAENTAETAAPQQEEPAV